MPGVALHIVQRGNDRQAVFFGPVDYHAYLDTLFESSGRYDVAVHAFVCMTHHVHLLVTPPKRALTPFPTTVARGISSGDECDSTGRPWAC